MLAGCFFITKLRNAHINKGNYLDILNKIKQNDEFTYIFKE